MMRIVIAGSRGFEDYALLEPTLDRILNEQTDAIELISGHAKGLIFWRRNMPKRMNFPFISSSRIGKPMGRRLARSGTVRCWITQRRNRLWS